MSDETTTRLDLPLLQAGQAQKELSHNEALTLLDLAVQAVVTEVGRDAPPTAPALGTCWVAGAAASGAWAAQAHALVGWTTGGWRFVAAREGMRVWSLADGAEARFSAGAWRIAPLRDMSLTFAGTQVVGVQQPGVATPAGGTVIDAEARAALAAVLAVLRSHGLIAR